VGGADTATSEGEVIGLSLRQLLKRASYGVFRLGDRLGVHILPKHYYTPVPDLDWLNRNREAWAGRATFDRVSWSLDHQLEWLRRVCDPYYGEVEGWEVFNGVQRQVAGPGFGPVESQVLHCVVRHYQPRRIVEVGSGMSTLCLLNAGARNAREGGPLPDITCVEPFPWSALQRRSDVQLVVSPVQLVDSAVFEKLQAGDLLFIDSSHAVKVGSDLPRIYLDVIPNLAPGVLVHIHDIFFPYVYPRDVLRTYFGWQESTLLLALLTDNPRLHVLGCLSALHYDRQSGLRSVLRDYKPQRDDEGLEPPDEVGKGHFPSSIYLVTSDTAGRAGSGAAGQGSTDRSSLELGSDCG
jgi:predicted O-methyltransferase YrrM